MKRISTLFLAACMVLGSFAQASALEVTASGQMNFTFGFKDNKNFNSTEEDHFMARQRTRVQAEFAATEYLKGVFQLEHGNGNEWGSKGGLTDYAVTNDGGKLTVRRAFLDLRVPNTTVQVKAGLQEVGLPSLTGFNNPVLNAEVAGIVSSVKATDNISLAGMWLRPYKSTGLNNNYKDNDMDMFGVVADFNYSKFHVIPWFAYASIGANSGFWNDPAAAGGGMAGKTEALQYLGFDKDGNVTGFKDASNLYTGGVAMKFSPIDGLGIKMDAIYGALNNNGRENGNNAPETRGWLVAGLVDYQLGFATPGVFGWYASGDDKDDARKNQYGRLPVIFNGVKGFGPLNIGFGGSFNQGEDTFISKTGAGTWGVGAQLADISFVDNLTHVVRLGYYGGTNAKDAEHAGDTQWRRIAGEVVYLTTKDYALEADLNTRYKIYENLDAGLDLGYVYLNIDDKYNRNREGGKYTKTSAWRAQVCFQYNF